MTAGLTTDAIGRLIERPSPFETHIAQALAYAFWETAERPTAWLAIPPLEREVFFIMARRAILAGQAWRRERA